MIIEEGPRPTAQPRTGPGTTRTGLSAAELAAETQTEAGARHAYAVRMAKARQHRDRGEEDRAAAIEAAADARIRQVMAKIQTW